MNNLDLDGEFEQDEESSVQVPYGATGSLNAEFAVVNGEETEAVELDEDF
jgi:hypothetical protein